MNDMRDVDHGPRVSDPTDRAHITLLQSEIDVATTFLCLAEHDIRAAANTARAAELIKKAFLGHKTVVQELARVPISVVEKTELLENAAKLLDAISAVERQFQVLLEGGTANAVKNQSEDQRST